MANWLYSMELKHVSEFLDNGGDTVEASRLVIEAIKKLAKEIRLGDVILPGSSQRVHRDRVIDMVEELVGDVLEYFTDIVEIEIDDPSEFDYALVHLYDWADTVLDSEWPTSKMCWINTH